MAENGGNNSNSLLNINCNNPVEAPQSPKIQTTSSKGSLSPTSSHIKLPISCDVRRGRGNGKYHLLRRRGISRALLRDEKRSESRSRNL